MFALEARNLTKTFGGLTAVSDLTIEVNPGEVLGLIGPNGAGKTTVFNCLTGFLPVDRGEIRLYDRNITRVKPHDICRLGLTRTFQIVRPFVTVSVLENILVGALLRRRSMGSARELATEVLEITGLEDLAGRPAGELPLPQRKRLELAKALATQPKVLLLDEVMAGLNPSEVDDMIRLIRTVHQRGITVILIEHVMRGVMALSERVVVINYGRKIASGPPEEVVRNELVIEAYLGQEFLNAQG